MKLLAATLFTLVLPTLAQATPGDISCKVPGTSIEVVVYRDGGIGEDILSKMLINLNGKLLVDLGAPESIKENVGTQDLAFSAIVAQSGKNSAKIRFVEAGNDSLIVSVKVPSKGIAIDQIESLCDL